MISYKLKEILQKIATLIINNLFVVLLCYKIDHKYFFWNFCKLVYFIFSATNSAITHGMHFISFANLAKTASFAFKVSRWRNGLVRLQQRPCYLQGPGFESHPRPAELFSCNKVSPLSSRTQTLTFVLCCTVWKPCFLS